jgi:hypothetical protein
LRIRVRPLFAGYLHPTVDREHEHIAIYRSGAELPVELITCEVELDGGYIPVSTGMRSGCDCKQLEMWNSRGAAVDAVDIDSHHLDADVIRRIPIRHLKSAVRETIGGITVPALLGQALGLGTAERVITCDGTEVERKIART